VATDAPACGERLVHRPEPINPSALSIALITILTLLISLGCSAVVVVLAAKKQQRSGHAFVPLEWYLSIILGSLSFLFAGFVQKTCERVCTEAWIATFNENWQPRTTHARYGWLRYLPQVLRHTDTKIYFNERKWANDEKWREEEKPKLVKLASTMAAPFRRIAAVATLAWAKLLHLLYTS
jgi:hypothetical protein